MFIVKEWTQLKTSSDVVENGGRNDSVIWILDHDVNNSCIGFLKETFLFGNILDSLCHWGRSNDKIYIFGWIRTKNSTLEFSFNISVRIKEKLYKL